MTALKPQTIDVAEVYEANYSDREDNTKSKIKVVNDRCSDQDVNDSAREALKYQLDENSKDIGIIPQSRNMDYQETANIVEFVKKETAENPAEGEQQEEQKEPASVDLVSLPKPETPIEKYQIARPTDSPNIRKKQTQTPKRIGLKSSVKSPSKKGGSKKSKAAAPDAELKKMADEIKRMSLANNPVSSGGGTVEKDKDSLPPHLEAIRVYQEPLPLSKMPVGSSSKQRIMTINSQGTNRDPINIEVKNSDLFAGNSQAILSQTNQKEDEEAN